MYAEAAPAPAAVREQLGINAVRVARLAERLRRAPPRAVVTCARGSSDHAATFARYLIETRLGLLTSSAAPSVSSVYEAAPNLAGAVMIAISQSGASPDLLAAVNSARSALSPSMLVLLRGKGFDRPEKEIAKILRFRGTRLNAGIEIYNALNANAVLTYAQNFSTAVQSGAGAWLQPTQVMTPRFFKVTAQFDF